MTHQFSNPMIVAQVLSLVSPELRRARNDTDLKTRLERLGFGFRDTRRGRVLTTVPHGVEVAKLPSAFA